ncbi:ScbR family autoregulator-binding transcription factor [Streptomyces sp. NPDC002328]|uniref:ScbR family autoregulator-binding transcription factor n=1 Tax=Streptomyces sp. NPDC002328 TaxID=3364642 RepID=UPI00367F1AF8
MVKQERAARTRQALIRAGAQTFAQEGFAPSSLSRISARAGVSNGALHFHFESKKALALAVEAQALHTVRQIVDDARTADGGPLQALVDATHALTAALADDVVVRAGFALGGAPGRDPAPSLRGEWQRWVEQTLRHADADGWLAPGISPDTAACAVVAAVVGLETLGGQDRTWLSEHKVTALWNLLLPRLTRRHTLLTPQARTTT